MNPGGEGDRRAIHEMASFMADRAAAPPVSTPADPQQGIRLTPLGLPAVGSDPSPNSCYQLAALSSPSRWPIPALDTYKRLQGEPPIRRPR